MEDGQQLDTDAILKDFTLRFEAARNARSDFDTKRDRIDKAYEPWRVDWGDEDDGRAHLRTPHIYHQGETLNANMIDPDASVEVTPREYSDEGSAKACGAWLGYSFERCDYPSKISQVIRIGNRYGLGIGKTYWNRVDQVRVVRNEPTIWHRLTGQDPGTHEVTDVLEDDPNVAVVDLRDFWWNPGATGLHDLTDAYHRSFVPIEDLRQAEADGIYFDIEKLGDGGATDDAPKPLGESKEQADDRVKTNDRGVEVIEWYNRRQRCMYVIANRKVLIGHREFPFEYCRRANDIPFAIYRPIPSHTSFEGTSPVEVLEPLQENVWIMENQRIDSVSLALNPTLLVDKNLKGTDFTIQAGGRIFVNRPDQIKQLQIDSQAAQGWNEVQAYLGYMQQVSGVSPYVSGADPSMMGINQDTATGVNQLSTAAGNRIRLYARELDSFVKRVAYQFLEMAKEMVDEARIVRIVGQGEDQAVPFSSDSVPVAYDLRVKGVSDFANKQQKVTDDLNRLNSLSPFEGMPFPDGTQFTVKPLLKKVIDDSGLNPDACFVQVQPGTQAMQQAQVAQAQGEAQQAMMAGDPQMQMMLQGGGDQQQQGLNMGDVRTFDSVNFKDAPPDAQAAMLAEQNLPTGGVALKAQLEMAQAQAELAKAHAQTQKLMADANAPRSTTDGNG